MLIDEGTPSGGACHVATDDDVGARQGLVPAGAVYYLDTVDVDDQILTAWLKAKWLCSVSEAPQAQRDGLGLALFGAWDGALQTF